MQIVVVIITMRVETEEKQNNILQTGAISTLLSSHTVCNAQLTFLGSSDVLCLHVCTKYSIHSAAWMNE